MIRVPPRCSKLMGLYLYLFLSEYKSLDAKNQVKIQLVAAFDIFNSQSNPQDNLMGSNPKQRPI